MECRCYQGGEGRTKMKMLRYTSRDFLAYGTGIVLMAAVVGLRMMGL